MIKHPFGVGSFKDSAGRFKQRGQNQHDFSGWGDRLSKIEEGLGTLTEQFKNFQGPMEQEGMEKQVKQDPTGGITNLPQVQETGFTFDPQGGSLMSQLSSAYGGQTNVEGQMGRPQEFTQGFSDFFTGEGYYADPRGTWVDGPWSISDKPIDVGPRMGGVLDPYGNPGGGPSLWPPPQPQQPFDPNALMGYDTQGTPNILLQPQQQMSSLQGPTQQSIGSGINGLASLISQQGYQV